MYTYIPRSYQHWQPGDYIPTDQEGEEYLCSSNGHVSLKTENAISTAIQTLEKGINFQMSNIFSKLEHIDNRLSTLEEKNRTFEEDVRSTPSSITSSVTASGKKRNRVTPTGLQVFYFQKCTVSL